MTTPQKIIPFEKIEQYHKAVKEMPIRKYKQLEFRSVLDSLFNSIILEDAFPQRDTYVNEEHNVRADS